MQVTVAGGDLYRIALKYLGDATAWNIIAQAQTPVLLDPVLVGLVTLTIPPATKGNGGVLAP